ncbi:MAG: hypothetical protein HXY40_19925 [Chloroflexi bacterium]|nr:hypothetical protein [Chloroflexota bacterium]
MNSLRYRLQGVRLDNGQVSLQARQPRSEEVVVEKRPAANKAKVYAA